MEGEFNPFSDDYFERLGLSRTCTSSDIHDARKKFSRKFHPDLNQDDPQASEKFQNCLEAYDCLKDEETRRAYLAGGTEALREAEALSQMRKRRTQQMRKGPTERRRLHCTLEELYLGATRTVTHTRRRKCDSCFGSGSKDPLGASTECGGCGGMGKVMALIPGPIPGMFAREVVECDECHGSGKIVEPENQCEECEGRGHLMAPVELEVFIDKGMVDGDLITFEGEADESSDHPEPGDLQFVLTPEPHQNFRREKHHLFHLKTINLSEALTGVRFVIDHLDGRKIVVKSKPGEVIQPGEASIRMLAGMGMPKKGRPFQFGNLYIKFAVEFPKTIPQDIRDRLIAMLPQKSVVGELDGEDEMIEEMELQEPIEDEEPDTPVHVDATQEDENDMPGRCPLQ